VHVFTAESDPAAVQRAVESGEHFWLDLPESKLDLDGPVARAVGVDADRLMRIHRRGDRAGALVEEGRAAVFFAGASRSPDGRVIRVAVMVFATAAGILTLRDQACEPLDELRAAVQAGSRTVDALLVLDTLTASLITVTEEISDEVDGVENRLLDSGAGEDMLGRLRFLRQGLTVVLRDARSQRLLVASAQDELAQIPAIVGEPGRRVRDLGGHLALAADLAESTRMAIGEALDLSLSMTSNRLGEAAERLSLIATLVLPVTVVTGFFGMNFDWMLARLTSAWTFFVLGIGGCIASIWGARFYLRREQLD
jgi:magnesium transporter